MRMIDADTVHRVLEFPGLIGALRAAHQAPPARSDAVLLTGRGDGETANAFLSLPAWAEGEALGIKVVTVFPDNLSAGRVPTNQAVYLLFDGRDGSPTACIDGTALTFRKTAADSALGSAFLSRPDAARLLMVGAGGLAPYAIAAHRAARPALGHVDVWNRTAARAGTLADRLCETGITASSVRDLAEAVSAADIICCATSAAEPLILGDWLAPGTHLDLIGSFTPEMREADDDALIAASVYGDLRERVFADSGEIQHARASGLWSDEAFVGDLYDLALGSCPARTSRDQITVFKNAGGGHLDLMCARHLMARLGEDIG